MELIEGLGINGWLLVSQATTFLIVLLLLRWLVFQKIVQFLDQRKERIAKGLEYSAEYERKLQGIEATKLETIRKAKEDANQILREAAVLSREQTEQAKKWAREQAEKILATAQVEGEKQQQRIVEESRDEIVNMGMLVAERVLGRAVAPKDETTAFEEAIQVFEEEFYGQLLAKETAGGESREDMAKAGKVFRELLRKQGDLKFLPNILQACADILEGKEEKSMEVVTARELKEEERKRLRDLLSQAGFTVKESVRPEVLGGVALFFGGEHLVDATIRGKLHRVWEEAKSAE
ncbi:MAG: F0F1 ATP synthase subunit B [bacterium]|nr:F0F1 ATP synthase subunit B [bacterium]